VFAGHFSVSKIANKTMNLTAKFLKVMSHRSHFGNRLQINTEKLTSTITACILQREVIILDIH